MTNTPTPHPVLSAAIDDTATTVHLDQAHDLPGAGLLRIGDELIAYSGKLGATLIGVQRGAEGTAPTSHPAGEEITLVLRSSYAFLHTQASIFFGAYGQPLLSGGGQYTLTETDGTFTAMQNFKGGIHVEYWSNHQEFYGFDFAGPGDEKLRAGAYEDTSRLTSDRPYLDVGLNGKGCNQVFGRFDILEVDYGSAAQTGEPIQAFAANFEAHCEHADGPAIFGIVRFNSIVPIPTPRTTGVTIRVPADYPTIQEAIDAAQDADDIIVSPGAYHESIQFRGKAITVESEKGPNATVISGESSLPVVALVEGETRTSVLRGFTLRGGEDGVEMNSSPEIVGNIIEKNIWGIYGGNGALILHNTIRENTKGIEHTVSEIRGNVVSDNRGFGISTYGMATIEDNVIRNNFGGIFAYQGGRIIQNLIVDNDVRQYASLFLQVSSDAPHPILENNTIVNDVAEGGPAVGLGSPAAGISFANNVVAAFADPVAIACGGVGGTDFVSNVVYSSGGSPLTGTCADQLGLNGNIAADPLLVNPAIGDYHLQPGSPAIDRGVPVPLTTDIDGDLRPVDGDGDGAAKFDAGFDEFNPLKATSTPTRTPTPTATRVPLPFTPRPDGSECYVDSWCESGHCVEATCCNQACAARDASCVIPGTEGICVQAESLPTVTRTPMPTHTPEPLPTLEENGGQCAESGECLSQICSGGYCCDRTCAGSEQSCALPQHEGTCADLSLPPVLAAPLGAADTTATVERGNLLPARGAFRIGGELIYYENRTGNDVNGLTRGAAGTAAAAHAAGALVEAVLSGDANCDGAVTAVDLTSAVLQSATGQQSPCGADANRDGTVDAADVSLALDAIFASGPP